MSSNQDTSSNLLGTTDVLPVLQSKEERRNFYDKIAGVYDILAEKSEQPARESGLELLAAEPGERILEIGFGTGHCLIDLAKSVGPSGRVDGIDISPEMVERTRQLLQDHDLLSRVELRCDDAERLPYESGAFDGIFMSFTLELFDTPEIPNVLQECKRVLKPEGGRIVVVAISKEGKQGMVVRAFEWTHRHFPNLMDCRPIHARWFLQTAGFAIHSVQREQLWLPVEIVLGSRRAQLGDTNDEYKPEHETKLENYLG
jgi:demethylmenaquinone methyltransferase/2-methoxy-6-polyprenyl-1,4-benzoquinol methylase